MIGQNELQNKNRYSYYTVDLFTLYKTNNQDKGMYMECITATPPDHLSFLEKMARDSAIGMPGTCCSNLSC